MQTLFITALQNLQLSPNLGRGERIDNTTFITNDARTIEELIPARAVPIMGAMEAAAIRNSEAVIYSRDSLGLDAKPETFLLRKLYGVGRFQAGIWLYEDNCVNNELGFLIYEKDGNPTVSSNFIAHLNSYADGSVAYLKLGREKLSEIRIFLRDRLQESIYEGSLPTSQLSKSESRVSRAFYMAQIARGQFDVGLKVSSYCSSLETLYTTSQTELAHQLSERVAAFLEDGTSERLKLYRSIKAAYTIRSKVVHGEAFRDSKMRGLIDAAKVCDNVIRRSIRKIVSDLPLLKLFDGKPEKLDEYMLNNLLSVE